MSRGCHYDSSSGSLCGARKELSGDDECMRYKSSFHLTTCRVLRLLGSLHSRENSKR
ncbi:hypothetical protein HAX54_039506, partial [Datura stramonium]|nr:hypothetical protein [Datura stramonium]